MRSQKNKLIENVLLDLILLANKVNEAVDQAKSFRFECGEMGKQVLQLSQMLKILLCFITSDPVLLYVNPILCLLVISEVSRILKEALSLACKCQRKTIFCQLFTPPKLPSFRKLSPRLDVCIINTNRLLIIYNPDFSSVLNEIFLSLPQLILTNGSAIPLAWSYIVRESKIPYPLNNKMIKEMEKLMLCLARKLVEAEHGELQYFLMTIMEITAAAESNNDLRCKAFKKNSAGAKDIVEQLLRVIKESEDYTPQVLAIKSIGSLARIFIERENHHVISVLVSQLKNGHREVATEALVALLKFACEDNYLCKEHSKRMIEFNAVQILVNLLRDGETKQQLLGLELICYLALNADYSEAIEQARVVTAIQQFLPKKGGRRTVVSQHPELKNLATSALAHLILYCKY